MIGKKIRAFREFRGYSQIQLAELSGINVGTIRKYELGIRNPKPDQLEKIATALGLNVSVFLDFNIETVGDVLCKGIGTGLKKASGTARIVNYKREAERNFRTGEILVTSDTTNELIPFVKQASAIVVGPVESPENCHAGIVGHALDIPVVMCQEKVTDLIKDGTMITVDAEKGFVYLGTPKE